MNSTKLKCPQCGEETTHLDILDDNNLRCSCPYCHFQWVNSSNVTEETDVEDDEEDLEQLEKGYEKQLEEANEFDCFEIAASYVYLEVNSFLKKVIQNFESYNLTPSELLSVSKLFMLTSQRNKYKIKGYVLFLATTEKSEAGFQFKEIIFDVDGLELTSGGMYDEDGQSDTYSAIIFPVEDDETAWNIATPVQNFLSGFLENLKQGRSEISEDEDGIITVD